MPQLRQPAPQLGTAQTPIAEVGRFYRFWFTFKSWREFPHLNEFDVNDAECREERRWMGHRPATTDSIPVIGPSRASPSTSSPSSARRIFPGKHPRGPVPMKTYPHIHRVTYAECTVGNHIYYGRYLNLLEEARGEFFRSIGCAFQALHENGSIFPVIEWHVRYSGAARYDDVLAIEVSVLEARGARLNFGYRILNQGGALILEAKTSHACTTPEDRPKRLPAELATALHPYLPGGDSATAVT